jgi:DNA-binding GntR family transcriptional regulator
MDARYVTEASILDVIREALQGHTKAPEDAFTTRDLMELTGLSQTKIQRAIDAAWRAGNIEVIHIYRQFPSRISKIPAYRFR